MNLPNKLTLGRVGLAGVMTVFLEFAAVPFFTAAAFAVFVVAAITDYWDGRLARRLNAVTHFGQLMDPLADKILVSAAFISFAAVGQIVPAWIVILIIGREFAVTGLRLLAAKEGRIIEAGVWGKHKTAWQLIVIVTVLAGLTLQNDLLPLLLSPEAWQRAMPLYALWFRRLVFALSLVAAGLTLVSGGIYLRENRTVFMDQT